MKLCTHENSLCTMYTCQLLKLHLKSGEAPIFCMTATTDAVRHASCHLTTSEVAVLVLVAILLKSFWCPFQSAMTPVLCQVLCNTLNGTVCWANPVLPPKFMSTFVVGFL